MIDFIKCFRIAKITGDVLVFDHNFQIYDVVPLNGVILKENHNNKIEIIKNFNRQQHDTSI